MENENTTSTRDYHLPHIDSEYPHWIAIYYVNDSDGDTHIFEEKTSKIEIMSGLGEPKYMLDGTPYLEDWEITSR